MNPLQERQIRKLEKEGYGDLSRKIQEIIDWINEPSINVNMMKDKSVEEYIKLRISDVRKLLK